MPWLHGGASVVIPPVINCNDCLQWPLREVAMATSWLGKCRAVMEGAVVHCCLVTVAMATRVSRAVGYDANEE